MSQLPDMGDPPFHPLDSSPGEEPHEIAFRERELRRRKSIRVIRGWLRLKRRSRTFAVLLLTLCAVIAASLAFVLGKWGWSLLGPRVPLSIICVWPLLLLGLRWQADSLFAVFDLGGQFREYLIHDDAAESAPYRDEAIPEGWRAAFDEGGKRATGEALGRALGGTGCIGLVALAALTAGSYLLWDLVQSGPTLLAQTMHDHCLYRSRLALFGRVAFHDWWGGTAMMTAGHFLGVALAAWALAWVFLLGRP